MNASSRIFQIKIQQALKNCIGLDRQKLNINLKNIFKITGLSFFSYLMLNKISDKKAKNCGIIGYLGTDPNAVQICVEGIQILQFRGYDSAGVCTINKEGFQIEKCASDYLGNDQGDCIKKIVESVPKTFAPAKVGIGHTRWATHGRKISLNAHPHFDFSNKIALVHNGIVDNYKELKDFLKSNDIEVVSETDSEVIVQLIGYYYNTKGLDFKEAVSKTLNTHIVGSYALAIINSDRPDKMIVARSGSPLLVGTGKDFFIVSSDAAAFQKWTNNYFNIENGEILELDLSMNLSHIKIKTTTSQEVLLKPKNGYDHFMLQEIMEQPDTINRAMNYGSRFKPISNTLFGVKLGGLEQYVDFLKNTKNLVIVACGTSYFASMFVVNLIRKLEIFNTVQVVDGAEFSVDYIPKENPAIIFVSQSGETFDVLRPLEIARNKGVICIGIVNKVESTLAKSVLCGVFVNAGREISVASTKAFSGQCVALILTTLFFSQIKFETSFLNPVYESSIKFLKNLPFTLPDFLQQNLEVSRKIAQVLVKFDSLFCLGKGFGEAIAREISLKIKEVSYIHAEGYNAGTFKHGPIAMIDSEIRTPVIIIVVKDNFYDDMVSNFQQIKSRNATTILLTNAGENDIETSGVDFLLRLPSEGILSSFYAVFIGQLIAYNLAVLKGYNPDKPRQLSKEITTK